MPRKPITDPTEVPTLFEPRERSPKSKCTQEEMEMRRLEVARRRLQGQSVSNIARDLNYSPATIRNDIEALQDANVKYITGFNQVDFVGESLNVYRSLESEAFRQIDSVPIGDSRRSKFIKDARDSRSAMVKLLQESGLLHREAQKLDVAVSVAVLDNWSIQQREMVAASILDAAIVGPEEILEEAVDPYEEAKKKFEHIDINSVAEFADEDIED